MLKLILIIGFVFVIFFMGKYFQGKNNKRIILDFIRVFLQTLLYLIGKVFYYTLLAINWLFDALEIWLYDFEGASVNQIKDDLKIPHHEAYRLHLDYRSENSKEMRDIKAKVIKKKRKTILILSPIRKVMMKKKKALMNSK